MNRDEIHGIIWPLLAQDIQYFALTRTVFMKLSDAIAKTTDSMVDAALVAKVETPGDVLRCVQQFILLSWGGALAEW